MRRAEFWRFGYLESSCGGQRNKVSSRNMVSDCSIAQPAVLGGRREAAGDGGLSSHMWILDTPFWRIQLHALAGK